jgi:serine protease Do
VQDVTEGAPADKAGLKVNDVITKVNGKTIKDSNDLVQVISETDPGDIVSFSVYRQGSEITLSVEIGSKTESALKNEEAAASAEEPEGQQNQKEDFGSGGQNGMQGWGDNEFEDFFKYFFGY